MMCTQWCPYKFLAYWSAQEICGLHVFNADLTFNDVVFLFDWMFIIFSFLHLHIYISLVVVLVWCCPFILVNQYVWNQESLRFFDLLILRGSRHIQIHCQTHCWLQMPPLVESLIFLTHLSQHHNQQLWSMATLCHPLVAQPFPWQR